MVEVRIRTMTGTLMWGGGERSGGGGRGTKRRGREELTAVILQDGLLLRTRAGEVVVFVDILVEKPLCRRESDNAHPLPSVDRQGENREEQAHDTV
jgi:hypothetical protein